MECHESLMQRRRKKYQKGSSSRTRHQHLTPPTTNSNGSMLLDKSLPSLPPSAAPREVPSPDVETPSDTYSDTPTELARPSHGRPLDSNPSSYVGTPTERLTEPPTRGTSHRPRDTSAETSRGVQREMSASMRIGDRKGRIKLYLLGVFTLLTLV